MERTSDFDKLFFPTRRKVETLARNSTVSIIEFAALLHMVPRPARMRRICTSILIGMTVSCFSPTLLGGGTEEGLPFLKFSEGCRDYAQMPGLHAIN